MFILLTSAKNESVFSSIDKTIRRDVISENPSERVIYQEQLTHAGRGVFKKTFTTACFVTEYLSKLSADFSLAKPGIMSSFQVCLVVGAVLSCCRVAGPYGAEASKLSLTELAQSNSNVMSQFCRQVRFCNVL